MLGKIGPCPHKRFCFLLSFYASRLVYKIVYRTVDGVGSHCLMVSLSSVIIICFPINICISDRRSPLFTNEIVHTRRVSLYCSFASCFITRQGSALHYFIVSFVLVHISLALYYSFALSHYAIKNCNIKLFLTNQKLCLHARGVSWAWLEQQTVLVIIT